MERNLRKDERGSLTVEAAVVVPLMMIFVTTMLLFNLKVQNFVNTYCEAEHDSVTDYAKTHRKVSCVYDSAENIYEIIFG